MDTKDVGVSFWVMLAGIGLLIVALGLFYSAIWIDGDVASKLAATGGVTVTLGLILCIWGACIHFDL